MQHLSHAGVSGTISDVIAVWQEYTLTTITVTYLECCGSLTLLESLVQRNRVSSVVPYLAFYSREPKSLTTPPPLLVPIPPQVICGHLSHICHQIRTISATVRHFKLSEMCVSRTRPQWNMMSYCAFVSTRNVGTGRIRDGARKSRACRDAA